MSEITNTTLLQFDQSDLPKNSCIVIVRTEWNAQVVNALEKGCMDTLKKNGIVDIRQVTVPGAFEITHGIKSYWEFNKYNDARPLAFIALGCVLRGDTPHFEYVCQAVTYGIVQLNLQLPIPTIFGILTVDNEQQAIERIGGKHGHKGEEAAITALKMIALLQSFSHPSGKQN